MRYLILSDLHANREALEAVLAEAENQYEQVFCCGDLVGYGADPNAVTDWVRDHVPVVVRGNHDKACTGAEDLEWFNPAAQASAYWTIATLTPDNHRYLQQLSPGPVTANEFDLLHGSPLDEDEYLISLADAALVAPYLQHSLTFFGHTHVQGGFLCHRNGIRRLPPVPVAESEHVLPLENDVSYLINPGSVGQPRDGDPRAAYALYDPATRLVTFRRVRYDIAGAQRKIEEAGLPDVLARRLAIGQ